MAATAPEPGERLETSQPGSTADGSQDPEPTRLGAIRQWCAANQGPVVLGTIIGLVLLGLIILMV